MTESEAIEKLRAYAKCQSLQVKGIYEDCNNKICDNCDLCYMQGTTGEHCEAIDIAIQALEEIQQYRAIGTVEECGAAVEKQKAKKPQKTESEGYRYTDTYRCPNCGGNFSGTRIANYCYHGGQELDWEGAERGEENE